MCPEVITEGAQGTFRPKIRDPIEFRHLQEKAAVKLGDRILLSLFIGA